MQNEFMACAIMSKYLIIVLLLLKLFHYGFADPKVPEAILRQRTEALRGRRWMCRESFNAVHNWILELPNMNENVLIPLVVKYVMHPVNVGFTTDHVKAPDAELSQSELEFRWEALALADYYLPVGKSDHCHRLERQYWQELKKRVVDATFGSAPTIEYPEEEINWPSAIMLMVFEVQRGVKALESLKTSNESPVSSLTGAEVLMYDVDDHWPQSVSNEVESAYELYDSSQWYDDLEHLAYRIHYLKVHIQRSQFIVEACSKFLHRRRENRSQDQEQSLTDQEQKQLLIDRKQELRLMEDIEREANKQAADSDEIRECMEKLSNCLVEIPWDVEAYIPHVAQRILDVKAQIPENDYEEKEAFAKLQDILAADDHLLGLLLEDTDVLSQVIPLFGLVTPVESYFPQLEASPYMGLAAEYHLLLLWRCMQRLSLLKWFKNHYDFQRLDDREGLVGRVNEAEDKIMIFARHVLEMFDFYENTAGGMAAQPRIPRMSEEERNIARKLLHPDDTQDVMDLDNTVEAASSHTGYTGAQEDIYNPGTTYRGADGESELGMPSRADLEGSSSSRSSLKRDASVEGSSATKRRSSRGSRIKCTDASSSTDVTRLCSRRNELIATGNRRAKYDIVAEDRCTRNWTIRVPPPSPLTG
ncbi:hypothetical protein SeMB42_g04808 [Synchytrium endobioticum]|uniref:Uncharacterized protein n=1 Tax=Synchytrium endobioticum TaxID=286115 RepID=A0A507CVM3_9FUNG|nr:hypothetical protein SeMB42_g04808 [Synchytrium endobioticum]